MKNLLVALAFTAVALAGCSKRGTTVVDANGNKMVASDDGSKVTYTGPDGKEASVETDKSGNVTVKSDQGTSRMSSDPSSVTEADLGLPFYPGSTPRANTAASIDTPEMKSRTSLRETSDSWEKVVEFYKPKLTDANVVTNSSGQSGGAIMSGKIDGKDVMITASINGETKKTDISVAVVEKIKK